MKLPFIKFYPADYARDTRALSLAAKGGWIDVLCMLHSSSTRGTMTLPAVAWARVMGATVDQAVAVISELESMQVADVQRHENGDVTLTSRRMKRDELTREQTRLRVHRHRLKDTGADAESDRNGPRNGDCNAPVTGQKAEDRRQNKETSSPPPTSASPPSGGEKFVKWFTDLLAETGAKPPLTPSVRENWADCYDKMLRLDGRTKDEIKAVCRWAREDPFWKGNFLSPMKLREKKDGVMWFDAFVAKMSNPGGRTEPPKSSYVAETPTNLR